MAANHLCTDPGTYTNTITIDDSRSSGRGVIVIGGAQVDGD